LKKHDRNTGNERFLASALDRQGANIHGHDLEPLLR